MSKADYQAWISRGRPFRLMTPAAALRDVLRAHGYTVYDIGDRAHLEREPPEDHTPYSSTGWPGSARYGVGYAIDIMPPPAGARSRLDNLPLPTLAQLGAQLLADRQGNAAGIRWLKYMNWEPGDGKCWQDSWKPNHSRRPSSDRGHIHLSGLTGYESSAIGAGYDPASRIRAPKPPAPPEQPAPSEETTNMFMVKAMDGPARYVSDGITRRHLPSMTVVDALTRAGVKSIEVKTTAELAAVAGPIAGDVLVPELDYDRLARAILRVAAEGPGS